MGAISSVDRHRAGLREAAAERSLEQPIRVLALIDTRQVNGPCRGLFQLAERAKHLDIDLVLAMFHKRSRPIYPSIEEARRRGYPVCILSESLRYDPTLILQAYRVARQHRVTLVQSHGYKPAVVAWALQRLLRLPWVAFSHGYTHESRLMALYNRLDTWLMRKPDRVVVMSQVMKSAFEKAGVPKAHLRVIHNAIDPEEYPVRADSLQCRARCGASADDLVIGVIGRLSPEKGQAVFVHAFAEAAQVIREAKAVLVGDGVEHEHLRQLVARMRLQDRLWFLGHCPDMPSVYAALDLVVIPSLSEGLPNVLLEAMLYRKPVVATAVGAIPEVMQGRLARWLVPPGDARALARAIVQALQDHRARAEWVEAGERLVRRNFCPARRAERVVGLYRELAGGR